MENGEERLNTFDGHWGIGEAKPTTFSQFVPQKNTYIATRIARVFVMKHKLMERFSVLPDYQIGAEVCMCVCVCICLCVLLFILIFYYHFHYYNY